MRGLKICVIGSGSTYTPELINGFLTRMDSLKVDTIALMDIDEEKNRVVSSLAERMMRAKGSNAKIILTASLEEAIEGADYILGQIRVGKLDARIKDEKIPLKYNMLGQETTGAGGFMKGLRTAPVLMEAAKIIERLAPNAWFVNFSNPSGMMAQLLLNHTNVKAIGLCNNPINMDKAMRGKVPEGTREFDMEYVGINHLSWVTRVMADGKDYLPEILSDNDFCEYLGGSELLSTVGGYPCGYLNYYYRPAEMVKRCQEAEKTRGEVCKEIEAELLELYKDTSICEKPAVLDKRGGALYSEAAASLIDSIENDRGDYHIVNTLNKGAFPFMACDDVVEVKCRVTKAGPEPVKLEGFTNDHIAGLMCVVKSYERLAVKAALSGCRKTALAALVTHPLIGDYNVAKPMLEELLEANKQWLPQFFKG